MKTVSRWVLAAALLLSGLGLMSSCQEMIDNLTDGLMRQWICDYLEDGTDPETGLAYDRVIEVYEFFENGAGYYECYLLNGDVLVNAESLRGKDGDFAYTVSGYAGSGGVYYAAVNVSLLDGSEAWTMKFTGSSLIDDYGYPFSPADEAQSAQIYQWYESMQDLNLTETLIGKWMMSDMSGQPLPTNDKAVFNFVSPTKAYVSAAIQAHSINDDLWNIQTEYTVEISGNKATLTSHIDEHQTRVIELTVRAIDDSEMQAVMKNTLMVDGQETVSPGMLISFEKVTADYSKDILGLWEGHVTSSEGSVFDDGEDHRWEYKADGTYVYYVKSGCVWKPSGDPLNEYFVDGYLLCTRWKNAGQETENREWWEIESIENGVMKWTALRQKEDGTTFTATFSMTKVQ